ncbi:MAG: FHIPEP family type III secretion protein [Treponema sp.]|nr:FHIPEP family type III secretion protein [Treponema sp.]
MADNAASAGAGVKNNGIGKYISFIFQPGIMLAVAVVVVIFFMVVPVNKSIIDAAMVLNLSISFVILLTVIYIKRAADFESFPQVVLLFTFLGLATNIASTRNILTHPAFDLKKGLNEQCDMVTGICELMRVNENVVVGFIIFIILIVVQLIVISKGADRVSEVTARFTLDAMNNKMFLIQQQQNSGVITEDEANARLAELRQEIDFYSAMDGSSKFVSGNVKAGIFITVINLVGGVITGVLAHVDAGVAFKTYGFLTIGDGLMSQIPALLLSFSTGLLITKNTSRDFLGDQIKKQFSADSTIYFIVSATLAALGLAFWNGATAILLAISAVFGYTGYRLRRIKEEEKTGATSSKAEKDSSSAKTSPEEVSPIAKLDELLLELGYALIPLVDREKGAELLERVTKIRREEQLNLGLVVPPIHIVDQMELNPEEYSFKIRGIEVGRASLKLGYYMCLDTGTVAPGSEIKGEATKDPAFGMDAIWLPESKRTEAEKAGYSVIDPPTIIATHLTEIIRRHASEIINRQDVSRMIEKLKETNPIVVDEVISGEAKYSYGEIEAVLKNLLAEQVSIRNLVQILETLGDFAKYPRDIYFLTEKVRESLGAQICRQYADENKVLHVLNLSQKLSQKILDHRQEDSSRRPYVAFDPVDNRNYISAVSSAIAQVSQMNYLPIILCAGGVRALVKSSTDREIPGLVVISYEEVMAAGSQIKVESLGEINEQ